jgi:hypothetical protein
MCVCVNIYIYVCLCVCVSVCMCRRNGGSERSIVDSPDERAERTLLFLCNILNKNGRKGNPTGVIAFNL